MALYQLSWFHCRISAMQLEIKRRLSRETLCTWACVETLDSYGDVIDHYFLVLLRYLNGHLLMCSFSIWQQMEVIAGCEEGCDGWWLWRCVFSSSSHSSSLVTGSTALPVLSPVSHEVRSCPHTPAVYYSAFTHSGGNLHWLNCTHQSFISAQCGFSTRIASWRCKQYSKILFTTCFLVK